jgi:hypothetical protein
VKISHSLRRGHLPVKTNNSDRNIYVGSSDLFAAAAVEGNNETWHFGLLFQF